MARGNFVVSDGYDYTDQGTFVPAKSYGSHKVNCDLNDQLDRYDPDGAAEFKREVALHGHIPMRDCTSWRHEGRRDLPASAFRGDVTVCIRCEMAKAAHLAKRQHKDVQPKKSWRKQFQLQKHSL